MRLLTAYPRSDMASIVLQVACGGGHGPGVVARDPHPRLTVFASAALDKENAVAEHTFQGCSVTKAGTPAPQESRFPTYFKRSLILLMQFFNLTDREHQVRFSETLELFGFEQR